MVEFRTMFRIGILGAAMFQMAHAFSSPKPTRTAFVVRSKSRLATSMNDRTAFFPFESNHLNANLSEDDDDASLKQPTLIRKVWKRFDTLESAGLLENAEERPLLMRGPGLKKAIILFGIAFLWKWYRARFINKIPVWDRQPQWNMVITSREQEKDLKAYTCKNCGSTLFIAKNREWFFSGDTGLGGLGCYTCGAKGKDNFVMDRDRILEDVGDDDDYFDYERPLDFVSAAERRALLKQSGGDEDAANQILMDQAKTETSSDDDLEEKSDSDNILDAVVEEPSVENVVMAESEINKEDASSQVPEEEDVEAHSATSPALEAKEDTEPRGAEPPSSVAPSQEEGTENKDTKAVEKIDEPSKPNVDDLDALGMDDF